MTAQEIRVRNGDTVILEDGLMGEVLNHVKGQIWDSSKDTLRDTIFMEVETACGIQEVSNEDIVEVL